LAKSEEKTPGVQKDLFNL